MILPPAPRNHALGDRLKGEEQAFDVDGENLVVAGFGDFDDRRHVEDAGVVDENVDPAPSLNHVLDRSLDGGCLGDVESEGDRLVAMACGGLLGMSQGNVGDRDSRSFRDIAFGDRRADAPRAASDERDFVLEFHRCVVPGVGRGLRSGRLRSAQDLSDR